MTFRVARSLFLLSALASPFCSQACSVTHIPNGVELAEKAELIVRVRAEDYLTAPANPKLWTTGIPDSVVRFEVLETLRGAPPPRLALHGYLVQRDDFNDRPSPYTFVRPGGRGGSCFANFYRQGAEYLLFLKRDERSSVLTVNWAALAPVNEQLHDENDPWLLWVRQQVQQH